MVIIYTFSCGNTVLKEDCLLYFWRSCSFRYPKELLLKAAKWLLLSLSYSSLWADPSVCDCILFGKEWSMLAHFSQKNLKIFAAILLLSLRESKGTFFVWVLINLHSIQWYTGVTSVRDGEIKRWYCFPVGVERVRILVESMDSA